MTAGGITKHLGYVGEVANAGMTIYSTGGEIKDARKNLRGYADDLKISVVELAEYSTTVRHHNDELSGKYATNLSKTGASSGVSFAGAAAGGAMAGLPGAIVGGLAPIVTSGATDEFIDTVAGSRKNVEGAMQGLHAAYEKIRNEVPFNENDVAAILLSQLNRGELEMVNENIKGGADPQKAIVDVCNMSIAVLEKADILCGNRADPDLDGNPLMQIAEELNKKRLPPAILLVDNIILDEDFIKNIPVFSQSPRSQPVVDMRMDVADSLQPLPEHGELRPSDGLPRRNPPRGKA